MSACFYRILGQVVDHLDALIDEWYPGLMDMTPQGDALIQIRIPCPHCHGNRDVTACHMFSLEELITQADLEDTVYCPQHDGHIQLALLVSKHQQLSMM